MQLPSTATESFEMAVVGPDAVSPEYIHVDPIVLSHDEEAGILHLMFMMPGCATENVNFFRLDETEEVNVYVVMSSVELRRQTSPNYRMWYRARCLIPIQYIHIDATPQDGIVHLVARLRPPMFARRRVPPTTVYPKFSTHEVPPSDAPSGSTIASTR